jgi:hypothetical protein
MKIQRQNGIVKKKNELFPPICNGYHNNSPKIETWNFSLSLSFVVCFNEVINFDDAGFYIFLFSLFPDGIDDGTHKFQKPSIDAGIRAIKEKRNRSVCG